MLHWSLGRNSSPDQNLGRGQEKFENHCFTAYIFYFYYYIFESLYLCIYVCPLSPAKLLGRLR